MILFYYMQLEKKLNKLEIDINEPILKLCDGLDSNKLNPSKSILININWTSKLVYIKSINIQAASS